MPFEVSTGTVRSRNAAERHVPRFAAVPEVSGLGAGAERAWSECEVEVPRKAASEVDIVGEVADRDAEHPTQAALEQRPLSGRFAAVEDGGVAWPAPCCATAVSVASRSDTNAASNGSGVMHTSPGPHEAPAAARRCAERVPIAIRPPRGERGRFPSSTRRRPAAPPPAGDTDCAKIRTTMRMRHVLTLTGILLAAASVGGQAPSAGLHSRHHRPDSDRGDRQIAGGGPRVVAVGGLRGR